MSVISDFVDTFTPILAAVKASLDAVDLKLDEIKTKLDNAGGISDADKAALAALLQSASEANDEATKVVDEATGLATP